MSADNWTECPRCRRDHAREEVEKWEEVSRQYGVATREEFLAQRQNVVNWSDATFSADTFREDYEFYGIEDGADNDGTVRVHAEYRGECTKCHFKVGFLHKHEVTIP